MNCLRIGGAGGVQFDHFAGFRILQRDDAHIRQLLLARILDLDGNQIVAAIRLTHGAAQSEPSGGLSPPAFRNPKSETRPRGGAAT